MAYYNTNHLEGADLAEVEIRAWSQEQWITRMYQTCPEMSPSQVYRRYLSIMGIATVSPITSIRRAISDLASPEKNVLRKTSIMVTGMFGKPEHVYKLID